MESIFLILLLSLFTSSVLSLSFGKCPTVKTFENFNVKKVTRITT